MSERKRRIITPDESTCDWILTTTFADWLRQRSPGMFWICGKPGSGKSTMMKFISQNADVRDCLPPRLGGWLLLDFFFDFRQTNEIGNSAEGLMRSLLHQLLEGLPELQSELFADLRSQVEFPHLVQSDLRHLFKQVLQVVSSNILVLVDGIDEFPGNLRRLMELLMVLERFSNL